MNWFTSGLILLVGIFLVGCASTDTNTVQNSVGQNINNVKIINIPSIKIEVASSAVVCDLPLTNGNIVRGKCLQYRQPFQKHYNQLAARIDGFDYQPGYRYLLDIKQIADKDETTGSVKPMWILNKIIAKIKE